MSSSFTFLPVHAAVASGRAKATNKAGPTKEDWERHRPLIKHLYIDEDKKLKEVMDILAQQHGHFATIKKYKVHITKWKFQKNNRQQHMCAILRKKAERDAIGKATSFWIGREPVDLDNVDRYWRRKTEIPDLMEIDAPTPPDISYRTPSPVPIISSIADDTQLLAPIPNSLMSPAWNRISMSLRTTMCSADGTQWELEDGSVEIPIYGDERIIQWTLDDMIDLISPNSRMPRSLSAPPVLLIPEQLFFTIKTYMEGSFQKGIWADNEDGYCVPVESSSHGAIARAADIVELVLVAIDLHSQGSMVNFRRTLSKMFDVVKNCMRQEHPRTIEFLLMTIVHLHQKGCHDVDQILRKFVVQLSVELFGKEHPCTQIYQLLGKIDDESLDFAFSQSGKVLVGTVEQTLGPFHLSSIDINLEFIQRATSTLSLADKEDLLRTLLKRAEDVGYTSDSRVFSILYTLGWNLIEQARDAEAESLALDLLSRCEQHGDWQDINQVLQVLAWSQYYQDKRHLAEQNLRNAIEMAVDNWGDENPWVIRDMVGLEGWLREWGDVVKADEMKARIEEAIPKDWSDEQDDSYSLS